MLRFEIILIFLLVLVIIAVVVAAFAWKNIHYRLLSRDMPKWQREGWVSEASAKAILRDKRPQGMAGRLVFLVGLAGALLLLFAAISFVAANWADMGRLLRLFCLFAALWLVILIGWKFNDKKHPYLAEIAYLLGVGLFGVNIALIAQMFHIDSHPPAGVLMWTIGALASAVLLRSRAALVAAFLGTLSWSLMEITAYDNFIHWSFLPVWGAGLATALWLRWSLAHHLAFLTLLVWSIFGVIHTSVEEHWAPHGTISLFIMAFLFMLCLAIYLQSRSSDTRPYSFAHWLEKYGLLGLLPSLFALQIVPLKTIYKISRSADPEIQNTLGWLSPTLLLLAGCLALFVLLWQTRTLHKKDLLILTAVAGLTLLFTLASTPDLFLNKETLLSIESHKFFSTWIYGAAFLTLLLWLIEFGHRRDSDLYVWAALATFAAEVLYIYFRLFNSLLETSLFFFVGGLLTLGLAWFLFRLHQRSDHEPRPQREIRS